MPAQPTDADGGSGSSCGGQGTLVVVVVAPLPAAEGVKPLTPSAPLLSAVYTYFVESSAEALCDYVNRR